MWAWPVRATSPCGGKRLWSWTSVAANASAAALTPARSAAPSGAEWAIGSGRRHSERCCGNSRDAREVVGRRRRPVETAQRLLRRLDEMRRGVVGGERLGGLGDQPQKRDQAAERAARDE